MHYFIETLFHPLKFHLGSFVSRRRDTWGYIIHIQVLLELITESSLSLSPPEPPAEQQSGDQQRKVRAVVRVWGWDWPGAGALCPVITRDMESITNIAHQGKGKLDQNQQKQPVCSKTLGLPLTGARYLTSGLGMNCLVSGYLSEVWCYKVHFVLNLNGSHNTLPHWGWGMWTRLPSNRRRVEAGARQRASPASCSPLLSPSHTQHPELTPTAGDWSRSSHHLGLLPC